MLQTFDKTSKGPCSNYWSTFNGIVASIKTFFNDQSLKWSICFECRNATKWNNVALKLLLENCNIIQWTYFDYSIPDSYAITIYVSIVNIL